jgi:hypothetical protein
MTVAKSIIAAAIVCCWAPVVHGQPDVCSNWQLRKLDKAPAWYVAALDAPPIGRVTNINDSLLRTEYVLNDSLTLVQCQHTPFETIDSMGRYDMIAPGSLYLYGRDTVFLDSCVYGYSELSFAERNRFCVAAETEFIGPDRGSSRLVAYDLPNRDKIIMRSNVVGIPPVFDPVYRLLAYTDYADLYIAYPDDAGELVFKGGGGYAQEGECRDRWIMDIRWSPDGRSLVFKYYKTYPPRGDYELWEACLLLNQGSKAGE